MCVRRDDKKLDFDGIPKFSIDLSESNQTTEKIAAAAGFVRDCHTFFEARFSCRELERLI